MNQGTRSCTARGKCHYELYLDESRQFDFLARTLLQQQIGKLGGVPNLRQILG